MMEAHASTKWVAGQRLNMGGSSAYIDHADAVGSTTMAGGADIDF